MKHRMALALVLFTAMAVAALRAAVRRSEPQRVSGAEAEPVTGTADESRPCPAVTTGRRDGARHERPGPPGQPTSAVVFHELHADGHNALCAVCDGQYGSA